MFARTEIQKECMPWRGRVSSRDLRGSTIRMSHLKIPKSHSIQSTVRRKKMQNGSSCISSSEVFSDRLSPLRMARLRLTTKKSCDWRSLCGEGFEPTVTQAHCADIQRSAHATS